MSLVPRVVTGATPRRSHYFMFLTRLWYATAKICLRTLRSRRIPSVSRPLATVAWVSLDNSPMTTYLLVYSDSQAAR